MEKTEQYQLNKITILQYRFLAQTCSLKGWFVENQNACVTHNILKALQWLIDYQ